jgi:phthalate 4,5-cis-dihydrodiol dehydrogenase
MDLATRVRSLTYGQRYGAALTQETNVIGIGIIGAGRICGAHATSTLAVPETRLVGIADVEAERVAAACEKWGGDAYSDYHELLANAEVDAVVIGLPHFLHRDVTIAALEAGKHVLLEKPMAMTVAECDAMIAAEEASGKTLMIAHSQHYFPVNLVVREILKQGGIGNIVLATDTWYKPFHEGVRPAWFMEADKGGGMWPMNGSHMIDRLLMFLQSPVTAVKAKVGNPVYGYSATDTGIAFLEFASGAAATIMHCGYRDGVPRFEAEITGTEGQLRFQGDKGERNQLWRGRGGQWEEVEVPPLDLPLNPDIEMRSRVFAAQLRDFALALQEGRPAPISSAFGRDVVRIMEACEESSRVGREVRLA